MSVQSEKTANAQRIAKESAIISRARLRRQRGAIERWSAIVILFISFLGTIVALAGGWPVYLARFRAFDPPWAAILGGLAIQGLLTYAQWHYFDRPIIARPARIADAIFTAFGYGPLILESLAGYLAGHDIPQSIYVAWFIIGLVSYGLAWYPESRLVD